MRGNSNAMKSRRRLGAGVDVGVRIGAIACGAFVALSAAMPAAAHHSFAAEFDASREVKITGEVSKLEWANPHAWIHVNAKEVCDRPGRRGPGAPAASNGADSKDAGTAAGAQGASNGDSQEGEKEERPWTCKTLAADDAAANWGFELASPNGLMRQGWSRKSLQQGDKVTIEGWRARDDSSNGSARVVTTADGKRLFAGASQRTTQ